MEWMIDFVQKVAENIKDNPELPAKEFRNAIMRTMEQVDPNCELRHSKTVDDVVMFALSVEGLTLDWSLFLYELKQRLIAERDEPGSYSGVTPAEVLDSVHGAMMSYCYMRVYPRYGYQGVRVWQAIAGVFGALAEANRESLGPGEKTPHGGSGSGGGGWSGPGGVG